MLTDFRYAARMMRRSPMFTAAVALTVGLTIAADTAIFSIVNAVILRPLPYQAPSRIVQVAEKNDRAGIPNFGASVLNFVSWREQVRTFQALGAFGGAPYTLSGSGEPEQLTGAPISPALIPVLGVTPLVGHAFVADDEKPGAPAVALLGEGLWKRRFGGDPSVVGRVIILNDVPTTVVGVLPASLNVITGGSDIYTPLTIDPSKERRLNHQIAVLGRLQPGATLQQAQAEMNAISRRMDQQYPELKDWGITCLSLYDTIVTPSLQTGLLVLLAAVVAVLLIACANIANLLLSRAATRRGEVAVRTALGASQQRIVRQLLAESVSVSLLGGALGMAGAIGGVFLINRVLPPNVLPVSDIPIDGTVLTFTAVITVLTGLLFGIAPALKLARADLTEVLKQNSRGAAGGQARLRNTLAGAELALATILLIGAGLLMESLGNLEHVKIGFDSRRLETFQLAPSLQKYPIADRAPLLYHAVLDSLRAIPGVRGAALNSGVPFGAGSYTAHPMLTRGPSVVAPDAQVRIDWRIASPGYFRTMGIPLLEGRDFNDLDGPNAQLVTIVSQATARKFWGTADPIGRMLYRSADPTTGFTVIGVVGDVRNTALNTESPSMYYPTSWRVLPLMDVVVRTDGKPDAIMPAVRAKIHELDPNLALANVKPMDDWVSQNAAQPRLNAILLGVFAALALVIAAIGIYGVLAYSVNQRRREIGLRIALGAQPERVLRLVVGEGMRMSAIGIAVGLIGGLALGRVMSTLVYGVQVYDPPTFAGVALVLGLVALAACFIPAHRAARVDPMVAFRTD